jgi:Na+/H+ antiporter NhaC
MHGLSPQELSLLPPLLAIVIAIWKREVILALLVAIFAAEVLLAGFNPALGFLHTIERITAVFANADNVRILLFSILIGALLALIRHAGGVSAFVRYLLQTGLARGPRSVSMLTALLGVFIFIESYLSVLACGTFGQSLFDRFDMSRARLAFVIDSTCSPISVLILLNGWGAYVLGLLQGYGLDNPVATLVASIPLNFYALTILALVFYTAWTGRVHMSLKNHEQKTPVPPAEASTASEGKAVYFLLPMLSLSLGIIGFMYYTGGGSLRAGSGASSVLYAICVATLLAYLLLRRDRVTTHEALIKTGFTGMGELLPVVSILLLAFALGGSMQELRTGEFIAGMISAALPLWLIAPVVFLSACCISFTTGTSWGTFGILVPVAIPVALATGLPPALLLGAVLGGGVFGDHCSPISDSTVLSSLASGCDHLVHVRTQLPYALSAGLVALLLFTVAGLQA